MAPSAGMDLDVLRNALRAGPVGLVVEDVREEDRKNQPELSPPPPAGFPARLSWGDLEGELGLDGERVWAAECRW